MVALEVTRKVTRVPQDRREKEPRQQGRGEDVLDVAQEDGKTRDDQRQTGDEADEQYSQR